MGYFWNFIICNPLIKLYYYIRYMVQRININISRNWSLETDFYFIIIVCLH